MGLIPDSYNGGTYEKKSAPQRAKGSRTVMLDSTNKQAPYDTPKTPLPKPRTQKTGTMTYQMPPGASTK